MGLIVLMLDSVSAHTFARERGRRPHVDALARRGLQVTASFPGSPLVEHAGWPVHA